MVVGGEGWPPASRGADRQRQERPRLGWASGPACSVDGRLGGHALHCPAQHQHPDSPTRPPCPLSSPASEGPEPGWAAKLAFPLFHTTTSPPARRRTDELWFPAARHWSRHIGAVSRVVVVFVALASSAAAVVNLTQSFAPRPSVHFSGIIVLLHTNPRPRLSPAQPAQEAGQLSDSTTDPVASRCCRKTAAPKPPKPSLHLASPASPLTQAPSSRTPRYVHARAAANASSAHLLLLPAPPLVPPAKHPTSSRSRAHPTTAAAGRQRTPGSAFHVSSSLLACRAFF